MTKLARKRQLFNLIAQLKIGHFYKTCLKKTIKSKSIKKTWQTWQIVEIWRKHSKQIKNIMSAVVANYALALNGRVKHDLLVVVNLNCVWSHL